MSQFQAGFVNEAKDLLESLESALLALESKFDDQEMIAEVFRVMHSLKGTASMFGFDRIGQLTHELETIYDLIRGGKLTFSEPILTVSLAALDLIHSLLDDPDLKSSDLERQFLSLQNDIKVLVDGFEVSVVGVETLTVSATASSNLVNTYFIKVVFDTKILSTGSNPAYLIEDLLSLGEGYAYPSLIDLEEDVDYEDCLFFWNIILQTTEDKSELEDVFLFVEDECQIDIENIFDGEITRKPELKTILDRFNSQTFDLDELKQSLRLSDLESKKDTFRIARETIRVGSEQVDDLMNLVSQLVTAQSTLDLVSQQLDNSKLEAVTEHLDKLTRQLRDNAFGMSLIPLDNLFMRFRRLVRDTSNTLNKPIDFVVKGEETKLDKNIIEKLSEPLMHALRNSLDHGIESPEIRKAANKPSKGIIEVSAYQVGAFVHISVGDDGGGIDPYIVREKAISKGLISLEEILTEQEMQELIFSPGFSTTDQVSDLSGRGVGMDVVKQSVLKLRGEISLKSVVGKGTDLILKLPLNLSIIDGLKVRVADTNYIIPVLEIDRCVEFEASEIYNSYNSLLLVDEEQVPFIDLSKNFGMSPSNNKLLEVVFVWCQGKRVGLVVDEIIGEYQAVLKPLGAYYRSNELFSGATIIGDGTISLVIDTSRINSYFKEDLNFINDRQ